MFAFLVALLTTGGLIGLLHARDVVESLALETDQEVLIEGSVDWTNQTLTVYGEGIAPEGETDPVRRRLLGFRAAKVEARRNLLEMVGQLHIDARTKVGMSMAESDEVRSRITGIVKGARVMTGSPTETDGLFRIALRIALRNEFAEAVLPDYAPPDPLEPVLVETDSLGTDSPQVYSPPQPYTGLLVDARGLDLQPSMAPRLVSESGWEIYNAGFADRQDATQMGVAGYDKDMDRAMKSDRLGGEKAHPLIVKAQDVSGLYNADAVIADDEGIWVRLADAEQGFLSQCRVVFLLGPEPVVVDSILVDSILVDSLYIDSTYVDTTHLEGDEFEFSEQTGGRDNPE